LIVDLQSFDPARAADVSGWTRSEAETRAWCGRDEVRVPPEVIAAWGCERDVRASAVPDGTSLVAYGELWLDDEEGEVELARLIVAPDGRGKGVGRWLAARLAREAQRLHPSVFLRVLPENEAALRCYVAAGFRRVAPAQEAEWNAQQLARYAWLAYAPPNG
jgi:ribosomal protein S18 acetylase RimI-like enzyme